jgi:hypothetical protein
MSVGFAHLTDKIIHVGVEARVEQNGRIDLALFRVSCRPVQQIGQAIQEMSENPNGGLVHRDGHGRDPLRAEWLFAQSSRIGPLTTRRKLFIDGWIERARNDGRFAETYAAGFD